MGLSAFYAALRQIQCPFFRQPEKALWQQTAGRFIPSLYPRLPVQSGENVHAQNSGCHPADEYRDTLFLPVF
jgi:hypothetical protein